MFDFIKNNRYFSLVFSLLIVFTSIFVFIGQNNKTPINKVIESTKEQQEHELNTTGINDFYAQYERSDDMISLNWHHNIDTDEIKSINIYYHDQLLVDVTNYSSYQLEREYFSILPGENEFKLIITTKNDKQYDLKTKVLVNYVVQPEYELSYDGMYYYLTFSYVMSLDHIVDVPNMLILDDVDYERVHVKTIQQEQGKLVKASTTYRIYFKESTLEKVNVRFFFEKDNDSFDYVCNLNEANSEVILDGE